MQGLLLRAEDYVFQFSRRMPNTGVLDACKQKDVVSASEVYELSSGCNAEVGGTVMGTGHKVHALESPEIPYLFVKSQPHP